MTLLEAIFWFGYVIPAAICLAGAVLHFVSLRRNLVVHRDGDCPIHLWSESGGYHGGDTVTLGWLIDGWVAGFLPYFNILVANRTIEGYLLPALSRWAKSRFPRQVVTDTDEAAALRKAKYAEINAHIRRPDGEVDPEAFSAVFNGGCPATQGDLNIITRHSAGGDKTLH